MQSLLRALAASLPLLIVLACGSSDSGETTGGSVGAGGVGTVGAQCATSGAQATQCEVGAICGKPSDGTATLTCLKSCTSQADCGPSEDCNGVEGSTTKGCRPKKGSGGAAGAAGSGGGGAAGAGGT